MATTADERIETSETLRAYGESWDVLLRQPKVGVGSCRRLTLFGMTRDACYRPALGG